MKITRFEDIEAWQAAREMQKAVYEATGMKGFASDFDLRRQMRKTAISSMANIAEGFDAGSDPSSVASCASPAARPLSSNPTCTSPSTRSSCRSRPSTASTSRRPA